MGQRSKQGAGVTGAQAAMSGMKQRGPRKSGRTPNAVQQTSVNERLEKIRIDLHTAGMKPLLVELQKEANRHKFQTRGQIESKVRQEAKDGKIPKGQIGKTVERRWKGTQKRMRKFQQKQEAKKKEFSEKLNKKIDKKLIGKKYQVRTVRALLLWRLSEDLRETEHEFPSTPETLNADAQEALDRYVMSSNAQLIRVTVLEWL